MPTGQGFENSAKFLKLACHALDLKEDDRPESRTITFWRQCRHESGGDTVSETPTPHSIDMIRWTFTVNPARRQEIESHLVDLGLEVHTKGDDLMMVLWEEPEGNVDELIEELWSIHGEPFEVTHEEFHRLSLSIYDPALDEESSKAVA
jgi:hypothetical protein